MAEAPETLIRPEVLDEMLHYLGRDGTSSLLEQFAENCRAAAHRVLAALDDPDLFLREAHTMRGTAANMGATLLVDRLQSAERAMRAGDATAAAAALDGLAPLAERTLAAILAHVAAAPDRPRR